MPQRCHLQWCGDSGIKVLSRLANLSPIFCVKFEKFIPVTKIKYPVGELENCVYHINWNRRCLQNVLPQYLRHHIKSSILEMGVFYLTPNTRWPPVVKILLVTKNNKADSHLHINWIRDFFVYKHKAMCLTILSPITNIWESF